MGRLSVDEHIAELQQDSELRAELILRQVASGIAEEIRRRRKALALGQAELAKTLGTTQSRVSQMEDQNYGKLNLSALARVADALQCELEVHLKPIESITAPPIPSDVMHMYAERFMSGDDILQHQFQPDPESPNVVHFASQRHIA